MLKRCPLVFPRIIESCGFGGFGKRFKGMTVKTKHHKTADVQGKEGGGEALCVCDTSCLRSGCLLGKLNGIYFAGRKRRKSLYWSSVSMYTSPLANLFLSLPKEQVFTIIHAKLKTQDHI